MTKVTICEQKLKHITFPKVTVTYDRLSDRLTQVFTPAELKEYLNLYDKAQNDPRGIEDELAHLKKKHPHLPEMYNLMSYVYIQRKKIKKAEHLIQQNYEHNPQNLFAQINYADQCLRKNKLKEVDRILKNKKIIQDLCPNIKTYHFSEILGFVCLMGFYHLKQKDRELAMDYCAYAKMIDPEDPTVFLLEKKIYQRSFLQSLMSALTPKTALK